MSETQLTKNPDEMHLPSRSASFLQRKLPYIAVLTLGRLHEHFAPASRWLLGVLGSSNRSSLRTEWENAQDKQARFQLMWTQALHWVAILVTMNIVLLPGVQKMLPAPATSLVLLTLLALGTFLAGVNLLSLQICFLGLAMALAVPAIAWFKQSALFLVLAAILLVGPGLAFWPCQTDKRVAN